MLTTAQNFIFDGESYFSLYKPQTSGDSITYAEVCYTCTPPETKFKRCDNFEKYMNVNGSIKNSGCIFLNSVHARMNFVLARYVVICISYN
jgi:hypothetical protein